MTGRLLEIMVGGRVSTETDRVKEVRLLELLGIGGFGSAWKVSDTASGDLYVLKIVQGIAPGSVKAHRVRLEAEVSIPSEFIVPVVGLREWDPTTFLILFEYFPGKSLDKLLEERTPTDELKKQIFRQTLLGVADAHRHNVVHRDLKPANILVADDGRVMLLDFGVSKFKGKNLTLSGEIIGTMPYMAPELLLSGAKVADARADIYSLGHILYELAMGMHFWSRKGWSELKDLVGFLRSSPPPTDAIEISDFRCDFFESAISVLPRMVKIDPEQRYPSVDEVLVELLGYIPSLPVPPPDLHLRSPLLIVESGSNHGARTVIGLREDEQRILGRSDLAGNDLSVSRNHIEFSRSGDEYFVRDLGSINGTMVRGIALEPGGGRVGIRHGDRIKVGDLFLRFAFLRTS